MSDESVRKHYNKAAEDTPHEVRDYGTFHETMALYGALKAIYDINTSLKFLDLCCGVGRVSASLRQSYVNSEFTGVDLADAALNLALQNNRIDTGIVANLSTPDAKELKPHRGQFDAAFCIAGSGFFSSKQMPIMLQNVAICLKAEADIFVHHALITAQQPAYKQKGNMRIYGATLPNLRQAYRQSGFEIVTIDVMNPTNVTPDSQRKGKVLLHARKNS